MTREIVRWAIVDEGEEILGATYDSERDALTSLEYVKGCTLVKLTGTLPEPKKPRLLAPALLNDVGLPELSCCLYASEKEAREEIGTSFISWPAVPNAEGFYSLEAK